VSQEFLALGVVNILGSFFPFYPAFGAIGRSAVHYGAGAKTPIAGVISSFVICLVLLFLTQLFYYLPQAVLASIVMVAASGLIDYETPIRLWRVSKIETSLLLLAFFFTLFLGVEVGVLCAVAGCLIHVLYVASRPHSAVLGRLPGTVVYRNIARFPEAIVHAGIIVFRFDGPIFFASIPYLKKKLQKIEKALQEDDTSPLQGLVFDGNPVNNLDYTGGSILKEIIKDYSKRNIILCFAGVKGKTFKMMEKSGLIKMLGEDHFFYRVQDAVEAITNRTITSAITEEPPAGILNLLKQSGKDIIYRYGKKKSTPIV